MQHAMRVLTNQLSVLNTDAKISKIWLEKDKDLFCQLWGKEGVNAEERIKSESEKQIETIRKDLGPFDIVITHNEGLGMQCMKNFPTVILVDKSKI